MHNEEFDAPIPTENYDLICQTIDRFNSSDEGELYLFIVGITKYHYHNRMLSCKHQATTFLDIFKKDYKVKRKNTYTLFNKNATKRNILAHLSNFDNVLRKNDQLIIYFAGRGYDSEFSNFFIPAEGKKSNLTSFIPNSLISKMVANYDAPTLLLFDLCFTDLKKTNTKSLSTDDHYQNQVNDSVSLRYAVNQHLRLMKFLIDVPLQFHRQCFLYVKENIATGLLDASSSNKLLTDNLWHLTNTIYKKILALLDRSELDAALEELNTIVETNDEDLFSRIETLKFKFNELTHPENDHLKATERSSKNEIKELAGEVLEKINDNGFYLIKTPQEIKAQLPKQRIKILFTSANPRDEDFLRLKNEERSIEYELMKSRYRDNFEFIKRRAIEIDDLQDVLLNEGPQFIHFCGHGNCDGIALLNDLDEAQIVPNKPLAELFRMFAGEIHCIFLNSCHSVQQSSEISKYIDNVVCMNSAVPDEMAIHFAGKFYKSIGAGKDIRFSFDFAKNSIDLNGISGSDIPILLELN